MLKKVTIWMAVLLMVGLLSACQSKNQDVAKENSSQDTTTEDTGLSQVDTEETEDIAENNTANSADGDSEVTQDAEVSSDADATDATMDDASEEDELSDEASEETVEEVDSDALEAVETDNNDDMLDDETETEETVAEETDETEAVESDEAEETDMESAEPEEVVELGITLHLIGRASVRMDLSDGRVIYIDPAEGDTSMYSVPADLVLVTHQHGDHNRTSLVTMKSGGQVIECPTDITAGQSTSFGDIEIVAVSAYNSNHQAAVSCGFILTIDDTVIYHAGDTSMTDEMASLAAYNIDYALICMDGYYNMGPAEALEVANAIQADYVIPIHTSANGLVDQSNIDAFNYANKIVIPLGGSLEL